MVISPKFTWGWEFSEGIAAVLINGKFGFIDQHGDFIIHPQFEFAGSFREGFVLAIC